jgi:type VI secretion system protein ImpH
MNYPPQAIDDLERADAARRVPAEGTAGDRHRAGERLARFWSDIGREPYRFDLYYTLRRIEAAHRHVPLLGRAARPADEPLRIGQEPSLSFAPSVIASVDPPRGVVPERVTIRSFGLFGPNGPLPNHLTEYARDRLLNNGDATLIRFADILHQRLILLFYRAWADAQSVVSLDRPDEDRFSRYVASIAGIGLSAQRGRDAVADHAKLGNAGHLVRLTRNAEALASILRGFFATPVRVLEFCCHWLALAPQQRTRLGIRGDGSTLGVGAIAGNAVWDGQSRFRVELGAMPLRKYEAFLPGGDRFRQLVAWVRNYIGIELAWDARLVLAFAEMPRAALGTASRLGWTTWIGQRRDGSDPGDLVLDCERWARRVGPALGAASVNRPQDFHG